MKKKIKVLAFPAYANKNSNPYNKLLYDSLVNLNVDVVEYSFVRGFKLNYDIFHVHWPERYLNSTSIINAFIGSALLLLTMALCKMRRVPVFWTVHNLKPHQIIHVGLNKVFWYFYKRLVTFKLSLSSANDELINEVYPELKGVRSVVTHHGLYDDVYENIVTRNDARNRFGIREDEKVCLFVGNIKKYKNVDGLINIFKKSIALDEARLIIAGKFDNDDLLDEAIRQVEGSRNINIYPGFVQEKDLQYYFNAADLCVLPFREIFNSGSLLLSVSFSCPVLVKSSKTFVEYASMCDGLVICVDDIDECSIVDFLNKKTIGKNISESLQWSVIASKTLEAYQLGISSVNNHD